MKKVNKRFFIGIVIFILLGSYCYGQQNNTVIIQNNTMPVVIEKPVYIERYRTVYRDRPQPKRVARRLSAPIQLLGYLWVYPEDLGNFKQQPMGVIESINAQNMYGRDNWRIPTPDELAVLENNADKVGLGDDIYLATDHSNGVLRLVSSGTTNAQASGDKQIMKQEALRNGKAVEIYGTIWSTTNVSSGKEFRHDEANKACPKGWRLPTLNEIEDLSSYYFDVLCSNVRINIEQECVNPRLAQFFGIYEKGYGGFWLKDGRFIIRKKTSNYTGHTFWSKDTYGLSSDSDDKNSVRCVLDE
jgi:hypothetical protein